MSFFKLRSSKSVSPDPQRPLQLDSPPLTPIELKGYAPTTNNRLLTPPLAEDIRSIVPARLQIPNKWQLVYSLEQHGASLHTLYRLMRPQRTVYDKNGYVIVIRDALGDLFGCFVNEHLHPTDQRRFYGDSECFLWKSKTIDKGSENEHIQFRAFPYTGMNDFLIYCTSEFLSLGGGDGHYGLWCDAELMNGVSDTTPTFGNEPLSAQGSRFTILGVEVWRVG